MPNYNLNLHDAFELRVEEAEQYFPSDRETPSNAELQTHFNRLGFPMTRAHRIRELHPHRTAVHPLRGVDLLSEFVHPLALQARERAEELRDELDDASGIQESARLASNLERAITRYDERKGRVKELLDPKTGPLSVKEMDGLLPGRDVHRDKKTLTVHDGTKHHRDEGGPMEQPKWTTETARALVRDLARRKLHSTAREMEEKPRKRAPEQHIERLGVDSIMDESPHFRRSELNTDGKTTTSTPRKKRTPSAALG